MRGGVSQQFATLALFDDASLFQNDDLIGSSNGRQAVGNDDAGTLMEQVTHGLLKETFGRRVQASEQIGAASGHRQAGVGRDRLHGYGFAAKVGVGLQRHRAAHGGVGGAGARFGVSPGCTPALAAAVKASGLPFLPGVQTVSEALALREQGFRLLKFFPAESSGGVRWLKAIAAPLPELRFCPTGGIEAATAGAYLAMPNVIAVGGSWVAPADAVASGDFARITELAKAAVKLRPAR